MEKGREPVRPPMLTVPDVDHNPEIDSHPVSAAFMSSVEPANALVLTPSVADRTKVPAAIRVVPVKELKPVSVSELNEPVLISPPEPESVPA